MRDFIDSPEEIARRAVMAQTRPAPEWIVAKRDEYQRKSRLWAVMPAVIWLVSILVAVAGMLGFEGQLGKQWKRTAPMVLRGWGAIDLFLGTGKRSKRYKKAAGILSDAMVRFESAQCADTAVLDAAIREAEAALQ